MSQETDLEMSGRTTNEEDEQTILGIAERYGSTLADSIELYPLAAHQVKSRFNAAFNQRRAEIEGHARKDG